MLIHHLIWIRTGSGDCSDLGIRKKQTNISVDVKHRCEHALCLKQLLPSMHLSRVSQELCRRFLEAS